MYLSLSHRSVFVLPVYLPPTPFLSLPLSFIHTIEHIITSFVFTDVGFVYNTHDQTNNNTCVRECGVLAVQDAHCIPG